MDREQMEARLAQLGKQRRLTAQEADRLNRALVMAELRWLLAQDEKAESDDGA